MAVFMHYQRLFPGFAAPQQVAQYDREMEDLGACSADQYRAAIDAMRRAGLLREGE